MLLLLGNCWSEGGVKEAVGWQILERDRECRLGDRRRVRERDCKEGELYLEPGLEPRHLLALLLSMSP